MLIMLTVTLTPSTRTSDNREKWSESM